MNMKIAVFVSKNLVCLETTKKPPLCEILKGDFCYIIQAYTSPLLLETLRICTF